ncbi:MAG: M18 family aminopeptidase [Erysipelotrichaceae bacterium]|nr:M18 family aminopeptidase [Erysipelotrichaceae bacterium]
MIREFIGFINESPCAYGACESVKETLLENGYEELKSQKLEKGKKYLLTRNDTSIIAFNIGKKLKNPSLHICASHTDTPCFKLKQNPVHKDGKCIKLNVETYGGIMLRSWIDRPLGIAGRVVVNEDDKVTGRILIDKDPLCIIPSLAMHLNREGDNAKMNIPADITPIVSLKDDFDFEEYLSKKLKVKKKDILSHDLYLYPIEKASLWGNKEFVTGNHLDNFSSVFASLMGFIDNFNDDNINVFCAFDNEEVGSSTAQGAGSDMLEMSLHKICEDLKLDYYNLLNQGFFASFDVAQGYHPNHPEVYDTDNVCHLNKGICVKFSSNMAYSSDSMSYALFKKILDRNDIPYQTYTNKTGIRGGGTLARYVNARTSILSIDIGIPVWSMHSSMETCGASDIETSISAMSAFYSAHLSVDEDKKYII